MSERVLLLAVDSEPIAFYEQRRHESIARIIAEIKSSEFHGKYHRSFHNSGRNYFVPHYTIIGTDFAASFGIRTVDDLFGGVVPFWFLATKGVVHELISTQAARPQGWKSLDRSNADHFLPGYAAFEFEDACRAGKRLLDHGAVRVKDAFEAGGRGQAVARDNHELESVLRNIRNRSSRWAAVLELNLERITTYSIGHIYLDGLTLTYWGTQRTTSDNSGQEVYGGSDLVVVRGDFDQILSVAPTAEAKLAIRTAMAFDSAVMASYPEMILSRRNYDVGQGYDSKGVFRCGVLDQSWRIGGTSGVEVAAVRIFKERPHVQIIEGSSVNLYGRGAKAPSDAIIHFQEVDKEFGPMLMYTHIETCHEDRAHPDCGRPKN